MTDVNNIVPFTYDVFISYSTDPDYKLARKVEEFLESFHKLKTTPDIKLKPLSVCRDGADFSLHSLRKQAAVTAQGDEVVNDILTQYLAKCQYLLVLCSKNSAVSKFVQFEIEWFLQNRGGDAVLLAVTEGNSIANDGHSIFSETIIRNSLQNKIYYDLRGFKEASKHWQKVRDFEEELTNFAAFLNNETTGRILPLWQKEERGKLKRQRFIGGLASLVFLILAVIALFQKREAMLQKENVQAQLLFNYWNNSQVSRAKNDLLSSVHLTAEAIGLSSDKEITKKLMIDIEAFLPITRLKTVLHHGSALTQAVLSSDGKFISTAGTDSIIRVWNAGTGKPTGVFFKASGNVNDIHFSPDGKSIITACSNGTAQCWHVTNGHAQGLPMKGYEDISNAVFSPDGKIILTLDYAMNAVLWDATGNRVGRLMEHVSQAVFSPDGKNILTIGPDSTARLWHAGTTFEKIDASFQKAWLRGKNWNALNDQQAGSAMRHAAPLESALFSPDGKRIITVCSNGTLSLWNAETQTLAMPVNSPDFGILSAAFSPDGSEYVTANSDLTARVWNSRSGQLIGKPLKHEGEVKTGVFSLDGKMILTVCNDGSARLWNTVTGNPAGPAMFHSGGLVSAAFSSDGKQVLTACSDGSARVWELVHDEQLRPFLDLQNAGYTGAFSPDGKKIVTAGDGNTASVLNAATGKPLIASIRKEDVTTSSTYNSAVYSPDGKTILAASSNHTVTLWDATSGNQTGPTIKHTGRVSSAVFSFDGKKILTSSWDSTACVWDAVTGRRLLAKIKHNDFVFDAVFSPDGRQILTACRDGTARMWDALTGKPAAIILHHDKDVIAATFSLDGKRIVTASSDLTARLWDAATGKPIGPAMKHELDVFAAVFSPDGKLILTAGKDRIAHLWEAGTARPIGAAMLHDDAISNATFSPDGKQVLTAGWDKSVKIWNIESDLDISADLFKLQARVLTGCALNTISNEIESIQPDEWRRLNEKYQRLAREHYQSCKYAQYNLWRRFF